MKYDPLKAPDPSKWLESDETERLIAVEAFHKKAGIKLPNVTVHASFHVIVENQLADKVPCVVAALPRLLSGGLDRHEAIHAVSSVLTNLLFEAQKSGKPIDEAVYEREVSALTAKSWRDEYAQRPGDEESDEDAEEEDKDVDRKIRLNELQEQVSEMGGFAQFSAEFSEQLPPELKEEFLKQVIKYEGAEFDSAFNRLTKGGFDFPAASKLTDAQISTKLPDLFQRLAKLGVYLHHTDHLSDRELYDWLREDGLREETPDFSDSDEGGYVLDVLGSYGEKEVDLFNKYYADEEEREEHKKEYPDWPLPPHVDPPYDRDKTLPDLPEPNFEDDDELEDDDWDEDDKDVIGDEGK